MKVLMISTDANVLKKGSAVRRRMISYGSLVDELHILILGAGDEFQKEGNVNLHPANFLAKELSPLVALAKSFFIMRKTGRSDVVVTTQDPFETGLVGSLIKKIFKVPLEVQIHTDLFSKYFIASSIKNRFRVLISKWTLKKASSIRVVSRRIADALMENYELESSVLPIAVDVFDESAGEGQKIKEKFNKFSIILLMMSRLEPEKDIFLALESFAEVVKRFPGSGLVIVGDGGQRERLEDRAKELGLNANVVFEGWQDDIFSYYQAADVFLNTSLYEGYGRTLVEAALSGCVIITTDVGVVGDLINEKNAYICGVRQKKCFVDDLNEVLSDLPSAKRSGAEVKERLVSSEEYPRLTVDLWEKCQKKK